MYSILLGISTTIGYGTLFYSFAIMSRALEEDFGWSKSFLFAFLSLGILLSSLFLPFVGKLLDRYGARIIMSIGSVLAMLAFINISLVETKLHYIIAIILMEIIAVMVVYEAAFTAITQIFGKNSRSKIVSITLIAGFASTIFWPLITYLLEFLTWKIVYLVLGAFHIIALGIHLHLPRHHRVTKQQEHTTQENFPLLLLLGVFFSLIAIPVTTMQTHFLSIFTGVGVSEALAVTMGALIGPTQVIARIVERFNIFNPSYSALFVALSMSIGFILLSQGSNLYYLSIFIIFYSLGQGLSDIIKGSLPLYIFGEGNFGTLSTRILILPTIVAAITPFAMAFVLDTYSAQIVIWILICTTIGAFGLLSYLKYRYHY